MEAPSNCIYNYYWNIFFTFNSNIFLVIYLEFGDAQVYMLQLIFYFS